VGLPEQINETQVVNVFPKKKTVEVFGAVFLILVLAACRPKDAATPDPQPSATPILPSIQIVHQALPTPFLIGELINVETDLWAAPTDLPLDLQIPSLDVYAPMLAVGLTAENLMFAPKGPIGDQIWHTAFWFRGGGIPGDVGTATIVGHVNDPLGEPEIFANLEDLKSGDLIVIQIHNSKQSIEFTVDHVMVYTLEESSDPTVLALIFGSGPVAGIGPQPALDGQSHLTLITCAGNIVDGRFDHYTAVFATRSN
jgi:hypothetical protein